MFRSKQPQNVDPVSRSREGQLAIGSPNFRVAAGDRSEYSEEDLQVAGKVSQSEASIQVT